MTDDLGPNQRFQPWRPENTKAQRLQVSLLANMSHKAMEQDIQAAKFQRDVRLAAQPSGRPHYSRRFSPTWDHPLRGKSSEDKAQYHDDRKEGH